MNRHQLATLLSWAGDQGFAGRKRLQKVVFFLQQAGCQLDCSYTLHHFGPYSRDVANACDEMVAAGLIDENGGPQKGDNQYQYQLLPHTKELLHQIPPEPMISRFAEIGKKLINENIWTLELGSTILFYYANSQNWDVALAKACEFKEVEANLPASEKAFKLAQEVQMQAMQPQS